MRFTIIGHACLYVETGTERILVDPWLSGSCYWRSWWHFPPNTAIRRQFLEPDYLYLSHAHFDHCHYPSLRRISKSAHVLLPKFAVDVMRHEVRRLGFARITELPHGRIMTLPGGARLASYQYGPDDSALMLEHAGVVLADLNDCKIKGPAVRPMLKAFGRPTFLFKSHSFAQAYPICYDTADAADATLLTRDDFLDTFIDAVRETRPRYAVPFASMVAFLHPESRACNAYAVRPPEVAAAVAAAAGTAAAETALMVPGDRWSADAGFELQPNDYYERQGEWLARLEREHEPTIRAEDAAERNKTVAFDRFERHFGGFLRSLPPFASRMLPRPVAFHVPSAPEPYWILDFRNRAVRRSTELPANVASIVRIREAVLSDAIDRHVVSFVHISMRIRIALAPGGAPTDFMFWALLSLRELGYFPLWKMLTPRALAVLWRRRVEVWSLARSLLTSRSLGEQVIGTLMTRRRDKEG